MTSNAYLNVCLNYQAVGRAEIRLTSIDSGYVSRRSYDRPTFVLAFRNPRTGHINDTITSQEDRDGVTSFDTGRLRPRQGGHGIFTFRPGEVVTVSLLAERYDPLGTYEVTGEDLVMNRGGFACEGSGVSNGTPAC